MPKGKKYINFMVDDKATILDFISKISLTMYDHLNTEDNSKYIMSYKYINHSDLGTFGKMNKPGNFDKNLLYYLTSDEMKNIEKTTGKKFESAKQSCITLQEKIYEIIGAKNPRDVDGYYKLNDFLDGIYLVNDTLEYFNSSYTKKVFDKLDKKIDERSKKNWDFENLDVKLSNSNFTDISISCGKQGLGRKTDKEFYKLRHHIFKGDTFVLLFEIKENSKKMYILLEKNPIFFNIIGENNKTYMNYQNQLRNMMINKALAKDAGSTMAASEEEEVTRRQQYRWREMLANEIMAFNNTPGEVFCPITYLSANINELSCLFVASHIKGFKDKNTTNAEKYDPNNGLLLSVQADALFDKHMITITQDKKLKFSFLLDNNMKLKAQLLLLNNVFPPILNSERMRYLKYHNQIFEEKELDRKKKFI